MIRFDLYLEEKATEDLREIAKRKDRSVADLIREAVRIWLASPDEDQGRIRGATKPVPPSGPLKGKRK